MARLTRDFKETVRALVEREPDFGRALLTEAVDRFVAGEADVGKAMRPDAFGLWRDAKGSAVDGLEYQERLRRDW